MRGAAPVQWHEVTALFGGTFDPPHLGHLLAVDGLFSEPGVRAVRVIPSPTPPHKPAMASALDRTEMVRIAFAHGASFRPRGPVEIDLCEIERAEANPGALTFSFDTLSELRRVIPKLAFVIGTDQLERLPTWHRFPEVLGLSHWIVLARKGGDPEGAWRQTLAQWQGSGLVRAEGNGVWRVRSSDTIIQSVPTPAPALSSTWIRESLARSGNPPEGSIPPDVHTYLMKHRLYGSSAP